MIDAVEDLFPGDLPAEFFSKFSLIDILMDGLLWELKASICETELKRCLAFGYSKDYLYSSIG